MRIVAVVHLSHSVTHGSVTSTLALCCTYHRLMAAYDVRQNVESETTAVISQLHQIQLVKMYHPTTIKTSSPWNVTLGWQDSSVCKMTYKPSKLVSLT